MVSPAACCIIDATSIPGATNCRYDNPPTDRPLSSMTPPSPSPIAARKRRGIRTEEIAHPLSQTLRSKWMSRSVMRVACTFNRLFLQRAAGEQQEDVLQRAAAHEDRLRSQAVFGEHADRGFAVAGVDEHAVGQALH